MVVPIFGSPTATSTWQPDPNGRGTSGLLQSCLITVGLAMYSSIHLNIPAHKSSKTSRAFSKIVWVLIALLAPEWTVYCAWTQRRDAKAIAKHFNEEFGLQERKGWVGRTWEWTLRLITRTKHDSKNRCSDQADIQMAGVTLNPGCDPERSASDNHKKASKLHTTKPFSLTFGFFILMGGLAFDVSNDPIRIWPLHLNRAMLSPKLVIWCLKNGYRDIIPKISKQDIRDKSKANGLVKAIACSQALWFCLQFLTRLAQKLPVSLLELNTLAHAICALLVYGFWWHKPLDIEEPALIFTETSDDVRAVCATASFFSPLKFYATTERRWLENKPNWWFRSWLTLSTWAAAQGSPGIQPPWMVTNTYDCDLFRRDPIRKWTEPPNYSGWPEIQTPIIGPLRPLTWAFLKDQGPKEKPASFAGISASLDHFCFVSVSPPVIRLNAGSKVPETPFYVYSPRFLDLDEITLARLQWACRLPQSPSGTLFGVETGDLLYISPRNTATNTKIAARGIVWRPEDKKRNIISLKPWFRNPIFQYLVSGLDSMQITCLLLSGLLYGALHMLAFGQPLHTDREVIMWQISCITVALSGFVAIAVVYLFRSIQWRLTRVSTTLFLNSLKAFGTWFTFFCVFYIPCRVFLVVEPLLNVQYVDPGVYQTPNWSVYWPHL